LAYPVVSKPAKAEDEKQPLAARIRTQTACIRGQPELRIISPKMVILDTDVEEAWSTRPFGCPENSGWIELTHLE
jgi:hypothetical protein